MITNNILDSKSHFDTGKLTACYPDMMIGVHSPELANEIKKRIQGKDIITQAKYTVNECVCSNRLPRRLHF